MINERIIISKRSATTTILLIALTFSIFTPILIRSSAAAEPPATGMHKSVDVFQGRFSQSDITAVPDQPFDVTFTICPIEDAPNTVINFITPGNLIKLVKGDKVWKGDLEKDQTVTISLSLETDGEITSNVRAHVHDNEHSRSYYLHVATPRAVMKLDGEVVALTRPVPLALETQDNSDPERVPIIQLGAEPQTTLSNPESPGTFRIYGRWGFMNDVGVYEPAWYTRIEIWDSDSTSADDLLAAGNTDANGYFDITAPNDDGFLAGTADPYIKYVAENPWYARTTTSGGDRYVWRLPGSGTIQDNVPDGWVYDAGSKWTGGGNEEAMQAVDACSEEGQWIYNRVSWWRGNDNRVTVRWPREDWPHCHGNYIDLPAKSTASWDHVTVHHEYAHAVQYTLYGNSWPDGFQGGDHWVYMEDVLPDAWCEGWAEFMQCAVDNDPTNLGSATVNIETNTWYNYQDSGDMDGAYIEGSVASILWDIFDPVNTATDSDHMNWGFNEIFTVLRYGDAGADDNPNSAYDFWTDWLSRWPTVSTSAGPLSTIYWHYGINRDYYSPYGGYVIINGGAAYTTSTSVSLALFCKDWGGGMYAVRLSKPDGSWSGWYYYGTSAGWSIAGGTGYRYVYAQYMDRVGRLSPVYSDYIYLDTTKPTGSIVVNSGNPTYTTSTSVTLYLTYSDAGSGVDKVRYGNAGGYWSAWQSPSSTKAWTLTSGDGSKGVWYQVKDKAGLLSTAYFDGIILDTTKPTGSILINGGAATTTTTSVTLTLTYSDATSGVDKVRYGNAGASWTAWQAPTATKAWTLTSGAGLKRVYYQIRDKAGWIQQYYDDIQLVTAGIDTQVFFNFNPNPVKVGTSVKLEGILVDVKSNPIASASVKVTYSTNDGGTWNTFTTLTTNTYGEFSKTFTAPAVGTYLVMVSYAGDATYNPSRSTTYLRILATAPPATESSIYFNFNPNPVKSGTSVQLKGILIQMGDPIAGASVKVEYSTNNGASWNTFTTLTTNMYGIFSVTFTAPGAGTYLVRVTSGTLSVTTYIKITP